MSHDEYDDYDDDDYIYYDDGPYAEADDLAEHTMHSPIWMTYNHSGDIDDQLDEYELYPSDFFDEDVPRKRKRKKNGDVVGSTNTGGVKRRKLEATDSIPELDLGESLGARPKVVWKSSEHQPLVRPVLQDGKADKVALLKDWRERFKEKAQDSFFKMPLRRTSQTFAVVIEQRPREADEEYEEYGYDEEVGFDDEAGFEEEMGFDEEGYYEGQGEGQAMPPPPLQLGQSLPFEGKKIEGIGLLNGTSVMKPSPATNGVASAPSEVGQVAGKDKPKSSRGRKRKATPSDDLDTELEPHNGDTPASTVDDFQTANDSSPPPEPRAKARGRKPKAPAKGTPPKASRGRKRKATELSDSEESNAENAVNHDDTEAPEQLAAPSRRKGPGRPKLMGDRRPPTAHSNIPRKRDKPVEKKARTTKATEGNTSGSVRRSSRRK